MKKLITLALLLAALSASGREYLVKRTLNKTYPASAASTFQGSNKYGEVRIEEWDKPEIELTIVVTGRSKSSEAEARKQADRVKVDTGTQGATVFAKTTIESGTSTSGSSFSVDYTINIPRGAAIVVDNKYGNIVLGNMAGSVSLDLKYGNLTAAELTKPGAKLILGYGNASIASVEDLSMELKYGNANIDAFKSLDLLTKYTNLKLGSGQRIKAESGYDRYDIGRVGEIGFAGGYSKLSLGTLGGSMTATGKYGDFRIGAIDPKATRIDIEASYSPISLTLPAGVGYTVDASVSYGNLSLPKPYTVVSESSAGTSRSLKATGGNGQPTLDIRVSNRYGDITVR